MTTVIENLEDLRIDEVIEQFEATRDQVAAVLEFVAQSLRFPTSPLMTAGDPKSSAKPPCE